MDDPEKNQNLNNGREGFVYHPERYGSYDWSEESGDENRVTVDLSGLLDDDGEKENAGERLPKKDNAPREKRENPGVRLLDGLRGMLSGLREALYRWKKRSDAKKQNSAKTKLRKKAEKKKKNSDNQRISDALMQKPETYLSFAAWLIMAVILVITSLTAGKYRQENVDGKAIAQAGESRISSGDGSLLFRVSDAYRSFFTFGENVKQKTEPETSPSETGAPETDLPPTEKPTEPVTPEPTEEPTATAEPTLPPGTGKLVPASLETYYAYRLEPDRFRSVILEPGSTYLDGVASDGAPALLVGPNGKDLDYGFLRIQNPYNCPGFELRDVMKTPLTVTRSTTETQPRVLLYYTHTSEGYCLEPEERAISSGAEIKGDDLARNIVGRGNVMAEAIRSHGVGVLNCVNVNDAVYDNAYTESKKVVTSAAALYRSCELAIDLHVNAFEYPAGTRYGPVSAAGEKKYAKILLVVTQNDETNPNWRENLKLSLLIVEKLNEKVPGITLGIQLRNDEKYNTAATRFGLLAEIGFDGNLVEEADNTAELLGHVLGEIYG